MPQIVKFLLGGGLAVTVYYATLYFTTEFLGVWYVYSACVGFVLNGIVNFSINKFWTFQSKSTHRSVVLVEVVKYLTTKTLFFGVNLAITYVLVERAHVHYLYAQVVVGVFHVVGSFLVQKRFVFKRKRVITYSTVSLDDVKLRAGGSLFDYVTSLRQIGVKEENVAGLIAEEGCVQAGLHELLPEVIEKVYKARSS